MTRYMTLAMVIVMMLFTAILTADDERPCGNLEDCDGPQRGGFMQTLNLSEQQEQAIQDIQSAHRKQTIDIHAAIDKLEIDLRDAMKDGKFSDAKTISRKISDKRADLQEKRIDMQSQIYKQLNADQQKEYLKTIAHAGMRGDREGMHGGRGMHKDQGNCGGETPMGSGQGHHNQRF